MLDYYRILGVSPNANLSEIKRAHRKLSKKFHPDLNEGDPFFTEKFKELQLAYELLSDPVRRQEYDENFNLQKDRPDNNRYGTKNHTNHESEFRRESSNKKEESESSKQNQKSEKQSTVIKKKSNKLSSLIIYLLIIVLIAFVRQILNQYSRDSAINKYKELQISAQKDNPSTGSNDSILQKPTLIIPNDNIVITRSQKQAVLDKYSLSESPLSQQNHLFNNAMMSLDTGNLANLTITLDTQTHNGLAYDTSRSWYYFFVPESENASASGGVEYLIHMPCDSNLIRDGIRILGNFTIIGFAGPHQGIMSVNLKPTAANSTSAYGYNYDVELEGLLKYNTYYGPPNFGETPEIDSKENTPILFLSQNIKVNMDSTDDMTVDEYYVDRISLLPIENEINLNKYEGKRIKVRGKLFHAHTGHHHTDILMDVTRISQ